MLKNRVVAACILWGFKNTGMGMFKFISTATNARLAITGSKKHSTSALFVVQVDGVVGHKFPHASPRSDRVRARTSGSFT